MITFAFVALCMVLLSAALFFAISWAQERITKRIDKQIEETQAEIAKELARRDELEKQITANMAELLAILTDIQAIRSPENNITKTTIPTPFQKMEERYSKQFKQTLVVDGVQVPPAA